MCNTFEPITRADNAQRVQLSSDFSNVFTRLKSRRKDLLLKHVSGGEVGNVGELEFDWNLSENLLGKFTKFLDEPLSEILSSN